MYKRNGIQRYDLALFCSLDYISFIFLCHMVEKRYFCTALFPLWGVPFSNLR